ncbi:hypothetical protein J5226_16795 [Lysobacter sp. K5869]|uniref:hypothetical protein n=1 Tax=Lysobacter sp. K5869 TaxID=2820808 RepID=UPI001C0605D4|nr:hypothetical protein [Lysobacter sp. K5869]QWP75275.1 hypothetical protein J5226_16795 [Lysobacter sp. K5869]
MDPILVSLSLTTLAAGALLGGGAYEVRVVDPVWPRRIDIVQPRRGGMSRARFWIPAHVVFELLLVASLVQAWASPQVRMWLLVSLASHAAMRLWSAIDFIPKALAFERGDAAAESEESIRDWIRRSKWRLPLDWATCGALLVALSQAGGAS